MAEDLLRARARRAYELGQLRAAFAVGAWVVPLAALATYCCASQRSVLGLAVASFAACTLLAWRGGVLRKAAIAGLQCGAVAMAMPLVVTLAGFACSPAKVDPRVLAFCVMGGVLAGAVVAWRARVLAERRASFVAAASAVALLLGAMGCLVGGLSGVAGMLAGCLVVTTPALARVAFGR